MEKIISNERADIFLLPQSGTMVSLKEPQPKVPVELMPFTLGNVAVWGSNNLFPENVNADVRKTTELASGLQWKANALISGGLVYGTLQYDAATGEEKLTPIRDPEIEAWFRKTNIKRYLRESAYEFYKFWNQYSRITLTRDRTEISSIECMESMFTRMGLQNQTTGQIEKAYISANWKAGNTAESLNTLTYPLIDPYFNAVENIKSRSEKEYIYPVCGTDSGNIFYQVAPWNSVRESGWLEVAQLIPSFKKALLKNQYSIKYHFQLTSDYWAWRFPKWDTFNDAQKADAKRAVMSELDSFLKGAENSGKNIMSIAQTDPVTKKTYPGLEIIALDDKIKSGIYIEDSQEASQHIYNALGLDGTIVGTIPGKSLGAGSGSDKRVAYNIYITGCKPEQDLILEPLEFCFEYNGYNKKYESKGGLVLWFKNYWEATLDKSKTSEDKPAQQQAS